MLPILTAQQSIYQNGIYTGYSSVSNYPLLINGNDGHLLSLSGKAKGKCYRARNCLGMLQGNHTKEDCCEYYGKSWRQYNHTCVNCD